MRYCCGFLSACSVSNMLNSGFNIDPPDVAPTLAAGNVFGEMGAGLTYRYLVVFVTHFGTTGAQTASAAFTTGQSGSVQVSNIVLPSDDNVLTRWLCRTEAGNSVDYHYLATLEKGVTVYLDTVHDDDLGELITLQNRANSHQTIRGTINVDKPIAYSRQFVTAAAAGTQDAAPQVTAEYVFVNVSVANGSIKLPLVEHESMAEVRCVVVNETDVTVRVYPPKGATVVSGGVDLPYVLAAFERAEFFCVMPGLWINTTNPAVPPEP